MIVMPLQRTAGSRKHSDFPVPVGRITSWCLTVLLSSCSRILWTTRIW